MEVNSLNIGQQAPVQMPSRTPAMPTVAEQALTQMNAQAPAQVPVLTRTLPPGHSSTNFTPVPVGVVDAPQMPKTPIKDRLERARNENERIVVEVGKKPASTPVKIMFAINATLIAVATFLTGQGIVKLIKRLRHQ